MGKKHRTKPRFQQFTKREHKTNISTQLKGNDVTGDDWTGKRQTSREDFNWGLEAFYKQPQSNTVGSIKKKSLSRYSLNISRREPHTTTEEIAFSRNRSKTRHLKNAGDD